jgi:hypothetical protein
MTEDTNAPAPDATPADVRPARGNRFVRWLLIALGLVILVPAVVLVVWSLVALNWTYSEGDRAGYVQKFSRKGWVCKTWEGELSMINVPGAAPERWAFTVRSDSVAHAISSFMGKQVSMTYEEHPAVPTSCFGETRYYVTGVRPVAGP